MEDFLPELWESAKGTAVSELTQITRRMAVAIGKKGMDALKRLYQYYKQSTVDGNTTTESDEHPLLTIEKDTVERQTYNLFSVLEKLEEDIQEYPKSQDAHDIPEEDLDPDWFHHWRQGASDVSNDEIQKWWARLLRGQVSQPGHFSLRTLTLLRQMSSQDVRMVEKATACVLNDGIIIPSQQDENHQSHSSSQRPDLPISYLHELIELGFLAERIDDLHLGLPYSLVGKTHKLVVGKNPNVRIVGGQPSNILTSRPLTRVGRELYQLATAEANTEYLDWMANIYRRSRAWDCIVAEREAVVVMNGNRL